MDEQFFLHTILENPQDDDALLIYADWLEEQGDDPSLIKAKFLRLCVDDVRQPRDENSATERHGKLQRLAEHLSGRWLAVVSRLPIERCWGQGALNRWRRLLPRMFEFQCDRKWQDLQADPDNTLVRFCQGCKKNVYYCGTIFEARRHADQRHCVALDLSIDRKKGDLDQPPPQEQLLMGLIQ